MSKENPTVEELKIEVELLKSDKEYLNNLAQEYLERSDKFNLERLEAFKQKTLAEKRAEVYKAQLDEQTRCNYSLICKFNSFLEEWRAVRKENEELRAKLKAYEEEEENEVENGEERK